MQKCFGEVYQGLGVIKQKNGEIRDTKTLDIVYQKNWLYSQRIVYCIMFCKGNILVSLTKLLGYNLGLRKWLGCCYRMVLPAKQCYPIPIVVEYFPTIPHLILYK